MSHLDRLVWLNRALSVVDLVLAGFALLGTIALVAWNLQEGRADSAAIWGVVGAFCTVMLVVGAMLFGWLARQVSQGRGRVPQTIAAALCLGAWPPVGLALGGYMLWVCWVDAESRVVFDHMSQA